jgi:hypothetical protein
MEDKYVDLWWDVIQDIIQKDIGKVWKKYERNERLYKHMIFQMEKIMPPFEYEHLVLSLELETSDEEEDIGDTDGACPSVTIVTEEVGNLIGEKDSPWKEVAIEQIVKQEEFVM